MDRTTTTSLARSLDVPPEMLRATLGDAAAALRYDRYYSFRSPQAKQRLRPILTSSGQQRLVAFLTPDDGAALARRGLGGSVLPMTTVYDHDLLGALLTNAALGDLMVFEEPVPFDAGADDETADLSLVSRARLLMLLYRQALLAHGSGAEAARYVRCISWLDEQGRAGDLMLATTAYMLWRLAQGNPPSSREVVRVAGVDELTADALLARAFAAVQDWYRQEGTGDG
jgi:hypothetical protein